MFLTFFKTLVKSFSHYFARKIMDRFAIDFIWSACLSFFHRGGVPALNEPVPGRLIQVEAPIADKD